ncbi:hypothetical protein NECAME_02310 [Necator americanus]|uniref:Uncharacterized protein n=1 Tax=Necator americanus TaxID=51031 RepID=W2TES7_NECAM|nr:hypothetical protein NECAME_02310 [Necator americanus]ETN80565.1 hypothetical protein NECAME_02310 [Necator americanus]
MVGSKRHERSPPDPNRYAATSPFQTQSLTFRKFDLSGGLRNFDPSRGFRNFDLSGSFRRINLAGSFRRVMRSSLTLSLFLLETFKRIGKRNDEYKQDSGAKSHSFPSPMLSPSL